jgi:hypothetical protein
MTLAAQETVSNAELLKVITEQNKKIEALNQRVQEMEGKQAPAPADASQLKKGLMETNDALAQTNKKIETLDQRLTLGKGIDGLKLTGDLRVRYEQRNRDMQGRDDSAKGDGIGHGSVPVCGRAASGPTALRTGKWAPAWPPERRTTTAAPTTAGAMTASSSRRATSTSTTPTPSTPGLTRSRRRASLGRSR